MDEREATRNRISTASTTTGQTCQRRRLPRFFVDSGVFVFGEMGGDDVADTYWLMTWKSGHLLGYQPRSSSTLALHVCLGATTVDIE